jgi:chaperone modulatory protein CbpM
MVTEASDWYSHDVHHRIGAAELAQMADVSVAELEQLVADGALVPLTGEAGAGRQFSAACVAPLREAVRLRAQHHLDRPVVSLLLGYLLRIAHLEQQLRSPHIQPPHPQQLPREGPTPWREPHS